MAKGSFLVAKAAARAMVDQGLGGDIVYVVSKNAVFAGPNNVAYGAAKADQAHQVRLLAAELGEHGIRVNGVNPDARGTRERHLLRRLGCAACGRLRRTRRGIWEPSTHNARCSSERCLPEHVASAVAALVSDEFSHTTGLLVPVDAGVAAAFLR